MLSPSLRNGWYKFIKCRSLCKTVEVPQVLFVDMVIVVHVVLQRGGAHDPEGAEVHRGLPKDIKWTRLLTFLSYDRWDARCVSGTGAEHPDERREGREYC